MSEKKKKKKKIKAIRRFKPQSSTWNKLFQFKQHYSSQKLKNRITKQWMEEILQGNYQKKQIQTNQNFLSFSLQLCFFYSASRYYLSFSHSPSSTFASPILQTSHIKDISGEKKSLTTPINQSINRSIPKKTKIHRDPHHFQKSNKLKIGEREWPRIWKKINWCLALNSEESRERKYTYTCIYTQGCLIVWLFQSLQWLVGLETVNYIF